MKALAHWSLLMSLIGTYLVHISVIKILLSVYFIVFIIYVRSYYTLCKIIVLTKTFLHYFFDNDYDSSHVQVQSLANRMDFVTSRSSTKTAKRRIIKTTPHDSPGTLVF